MAGEGFLILPMVTTTLETFKLLMLPNTLEKVTLLPETVQLKVLTATESTVMERHVTFELRANTVGNMMTTVAFEET